MEFADLAGLDVALLGAGREGRSVWREVRRRLPGQRLTVYSETPVETPPVDRPGSGPDAVVVGPLDAAALGSHDVLVRSPGVSPYRPELRAAREAGVRFTTATNLWFAEHPRARTICISGTKGKSTTSALTAHLLAAAGLDVQLAGNIGQPLLDCPAADRDWWVIELSSYQLADCDARPTIGALLNLSDAHLEWHGGRAAYHADKLRLAGLARQALVANAQDEVLREALGDRRGVHWFGKADGFHVHASALLDAAGRQVLDSPASLPGRHNLLNLCAALTIADQAGGLPADLPGAANSFRGLPHRLQSLGRVGGIEYFDDSLATTPVATLAALEALAERAVTLIIGGQRQGVTWDEALTAMRRRGLHALIAIPDSGPALAAQARRAGVGTVAGIHETGSLEEAVQLARRIARPPGAVLLSPGAPSFPQFRDYADRARQFAELAGLTAGG